MPFLKHQREQGASTLVFSVVILVIVTFVALYTSKSIITETKITNNDMRGQSALEAAEAGVADAYKTFLSGARPTVVGGMFGTQADIDAGNFINEKTETLLDSASDEKSHYTVTVCRGNESVGVCVGETMFTVVSIGYSDDYSASRIIVAGPSRPQPIASLPENPLTARGVVNISGAATVINQEGSSTIWSGGDVASAGQTYIANPASGGQTVTFGSDDFVPEIVDMCTEGYGQSCTLPAYPECLEFSQACEGVVASNEGNGVDINSNDSSLAELSAEELFTNYTGKTYQEFQDDVVTIKSTVNAFNDLSSTYGTLANGSIIWIEGNATSSGNPTIGCTEAVTGNSDSPLIPLGLSGCEDGSGILRPSFIVVNGDLDVAGTLHLYGLIFVTGNLTGTGSVDVTGAMIVGGSAADSGSKDIRYDSRVISLIGQDSVMPSISSSGWRDF